MKSFALCIAASALALSGCSVFRFGGELLSSPVEVRQTEGGFIATQRAGIDRPAGDSSWETVRLQNLATKARETGICPAGIEGVERKLEPIREVESGTSYNLTYTGRCKKELPRIAPAAG
jgi:hypothetical protein